jgi:hypothetical protein
MTEEQRPICSGVVARAILHKGGLVSGMGFLRLPRAEIKRGIEKPPSERFEKRRLLEKSWPVMPIWRNLWPL